jgi:hypothetical protein
MGCGAAVLESGHADAAAWSENGDLLLSLDGSGLRLSEGKSSNITSTSAASAVRKAFVAGLITGASSRAVKSLLLLPLDTIRVRQQMPRDEPVKAAAPQQRIDSNDEAAALPTLDYLSSFFPSSSSPFALHGLYKGWVPSLILAGPATAVFFGGY